MISNGQKAEALDAKKIKLSDQQTADLGKYKDFKEKASSAGITKRAVEEEKKIQGKGFAPVFMYYIDVNMDIEGRVFYEWIWPDVLLFFFIGMALFKNGFLLGKKSTPLYLLVALAGIGIGVYINYLSLRPQYHYRFDMFQVVQNSRWSYYGVRR